MNAADQCPIRRCPIHADFDPLAEAYRTNPFAVFGAIPSDHSIFYAPAIDYYVVTRYADIENVLLDPETYSASPAQLPVVPLSEEAVRVMREGQHGPQPSMVMVSLDPPAHTRLRSPAVRAFTPARVARMEPEVRATVTSLLDSIDPFAPFDLVAALAFPLPATVIFDFLGIPASDWPQLKEWCGHRAELVFGRPTPQGQIAHAENMVNYRKYVRKFVAEKAEAPDDSFTSALLAIHREDPGALTTKEIGSILYSLTFAGHETTNYLIGNLVLRLLEDPARWDAIVADPRLIPGAVQETLRYDPSVSTWRRVTKKPVRLGGFDLPAGAKLLLWLAASGRDETVFANPDEFDPRRAEASKTLAFGKGIHYCIGAALSRLEAQVALEGLTSRFPRLRLCADGQPRFIANLCFRGPEELWVQSL